MRAKLRRLSCWPLALVAAGLLAAQSPCGAARAAQAAVGEDPPATVKMWHDAVALHDDIELRFAWERLPDEHGAALAAKAGAADADASNQELYQAVFAKIDGKIAFARSGRRERFEVRADIEPLLFGADALFGERRPLKDETEIHGDDAYFFHSRLRMSGTIRSHWPERRATPLSYVRPPAAEEAQLVGTSDDGLTVEYRTAENDLIRYQLDPRQGMMPVRVEFFDILPQGRLFLYQYFTVEAYEETPNGTFLPARSTMHQFVTTDDKGETTADAESRYTLSDYRENVDFDDGAFRIIFPAGTHVKDRILGVSYTAGDPHPLDPTRDVEAALAVPGAAGPTGTSDSPIPAAVDPAGGQAVAAIPPPGAAADPAQIDRAALLRVMGLILLSLTVLVLAWAGRRRVLRGKMQSER